MSNSFYILIIKTNILCLDLSLFFFLFKPMDLYFHRSSPKNRMLSLTTALKKKKTSAVGPEHHDRKLTPKSPSITDFISKKVSSIHAKKIWHQIVPHQQQKATILFDSNDHLADTASIPPTPPPKKSSTMPNLSIITDAELMHRALPSLPSVENAISIGSKASSSRYGLTRATTWVGKSIQKWLSNLEEQRKAVMMDLSDFEHDDEEDVLYSSSLLPNALDQKLTLHCRSKFRQSSTISPSP